MLSIHRRVSSFIANLLAHCFSVMTIMHWSHSLNCKRRRRFQQKLPVSALH